MTGAELCRHLESLAKTAHCAVVFSPLACALSYEPRPAPWSWGLPALAGFCPTKDAEPMAFGFALTRQS
jgi:hypothetical protein